MRGFVKANTIRGVLERSPRTLAEAKVAARDLKHIERNYVRLLGKEDKLISQFISLLPKSGVDPTRPLNRPPYVSIEALSHPLAVKVPTPMLALPAPETDPQIEEVEQILDANKAMLKEFKNLTDQMAFLLKNQQPGPPPQIESGNHSSGFW